MNRQALIRLGLGHLFAQMPPGDAEAAQDDIRLSLARQSAPDPVAGLMALEDSLGRLDAEIGRLRDAVAAIRARWRTGWRCSRRHWRKTR